jgi:hypothetical protein
MGWVHRTGVNGAEWPSLGAVYQTLTCRNGGSAGQPYCPGNVHTEVVAQRRPIALNGVEPQVRGAVEGDGVPCLLPEHFSVTEVRLSLDDRVT